MYPSMIYIKAHLIVFDPSSWMGFVRFLEWLDIACDILDGSKACRVLKGGKV